MRRATAGPSHASPPWRPAPARPSRRPFPARKEQHRCQTPRRGSTGRASQAHPRKRTPESCRSASSSATTSSSTTSTWTRRPPSVTSARPRRISCPASGARAGPRLPPALQGRGAAAGRPRGGRRHRLARLRRDQGRGLGAARGREERRPLGQGGRTRRSVGRRADGGDRRRRGADRRAPRGRTGQRVPVVLPAPGTSLADGYLEDDKLVCPAHLWEFNAESGAGVNPDNTCLVQRQVRIEDDAVWIGRPASQAVGHSSTRSNSPDGC